MVHLSTVTPDSEQAHPLIKGLENVKLADREQSDDTENVYGSHWASEGLPEHDMPDSGMPRDVAYRLIKDHLSLDGNPSLNLASKVM